MKLVMAIMGKNDSSVVMDALTEENFQVTKMASTGGFLKSGNTLPITRCGIAHCIIGPIGLF